LKPTRRRISMGDILDKVKHGKGIWLLLIGVAAGLLLLTFGDGSNTEEGDVLIETPSPTFTEAETYLANLERRIANLLDAMDGVSDVSVVLTPDGTAESLYAQNGQYENGSLAEQEYVTVGRDGTPILIRLTYPKLRGVAIVCRGGSNPILQEKIVSLLCALLDLPASRVYVTG
jgi:stage III sporulation protein AG